MGDGRGAASHLRASWGSQGDGMTWWGEGGHRGEGEGVEKFVSSGFVWRVFVLWRFELFRDRGRRGCA